MTLTELKTTLAEHPDRMLTFRLPNQQSVAAHFHITEVAKREKTFVDCGGNNRHSETCALQLWVALDIDHRLSSTKLTKILQYADEFFTDTDIPVEIDHQISSLTMFTLDHIKADADKLVFQLAAINAACLDPDKCGITPDLMPLPQIGKSSCAPGSGCC